jgi:hypothetical protein
MHALPGWALTILQFSHRMNCCDDCYNKQPLLISPYSIRPAHLLMELYCVFYELWTQSPYTMYITFHFQSVTKCQILIVRKHFRRASTIFMVMNTTVSQILICGNPAIRKKKNSTTIRKFLLGRKGSRCVGLTTWPPSRAHCLEILEASSSWSPQGLFWPVQG